MDESAASQGPQQVSEAAMANAIRALAMDAVEAAASGHPGLPMGMADAATVLFARYLKFDPACPAWPDRDRFVLSAGHGSMLLYALLHLTGYADMTLAELRRFRQLDSRAAGHPEYRLAGGIETTTGPLGQGFANAVGMALAERMLARRFGDIVDHRTYVVASDGCLMEGIGHEAASLAGHLRLARLIVLFDDNGISIDGETSLAVSDDTLARFRAYGWAAERVFGHDRDAVAAAIERARHSDRPSLIACRTVIGFGAPGKQGRAQAHGAPLGADEVAAARQALGWPHPPFVVPDAVLAAWRRCAGRGKAARAAWQARLDGLDRATRGEFERRLAGGEVEARAGRAMAGQIARLLAAPAAVATRKASGMALEALSEALPEMVGGSADLTASNNTRTQAMGDIAPGDYGGSYVRWGVREHAMAAAMSGMALHGGLLPYGGTFLAFSDYARPAIRLAALMGLRVVYVMTHDSIGLGEDGPTHQPVEHLASLRAIPNLRVFRPADAVETAECWALALAARNTPSVLALSRQSLPQLRLEDGGGNLSARGAYVLAEAEGRLQAVVVASGSEVQVALEARRMLQAEGIATRVVSAPCLELFAQQKQAWRDRVLPGAAVRVAVEAGVAFGWERLVGADGAIVAMAGFGASAPHPALYRHFGITAQAVCKAVRARL